MLLHAHHPGVLRGGTTILMLKSLERYDALGTRRHWAADSFQGLPEPSAQDKNGSLVTGVRGAFLSSREEFDKNIAAANIARVGERLSVLTGWFNETLPGAPIKAISYLRLDGDLYVSTRDALEALYDRVSPGGAIYVDDYGSYTGCRRAIDEFRAQRGITAPLRLQSLPEGGLAPANKLQEAYEAVWWIKPPCEYWPAASVCGRRMRRRLISDAYLFALPLVLQALQKSSSTECDKLCTELLISCSLFFNTFLAMRNWRR